MASTSSGSSQQSSNSQSTSQSQTQVLDYPERAFLDAIAQYAGQVGQNVYNWAQGEYAKNSALTDANINNYLNTSSRALGTADALNNRYNNKINPEIDQQLREADSYASRDRQLMDMGAAESGQMQGTEAALANHKRDLQSYGIDPSSGRYAGLDEAARVSGAAAAVGAAQQARQFDVTTGQNLRQQGIGNAQSAASSQAGMNANMMNTALQGFAGAENAGLANANTGVSMFGAANPFLQTAASYKPITGTNSQSQSTSNSQGTSNQQSQSTDPAQSDKSGSQRDPSQQQAGQGGGTGSGTGSGGSSYGSGSQYSDAPFSEGSDDVWSNGSGVDYSGLDGADWTTGGGLPSDWSDGSSGGTYGDTGGYGGFDYGGWNGSYGNVGNAGADWGGGYSGGAESYGTFDYAEGGTIEDDTGAIPEDGGVIPPSASPSNGAVTDDVRAQLPSGKPINVNAREFVIPEDVARWKGEEFFQKLIAQSRQARVMGPAKPSMRQANA